MTKTKVFEQAVNGHTTDSKGCGEGILHKGISVCKGSDIHGLVLQTRGDTLRKLHFEGKVVRRG